MNIIDKYIIRKYLTTFLFTMAIFAVVIVVFDISEKLDDFLKHKAPTEKIIFEYYAGLLPFYLNMLSPLINFIAVIFFTAKMADQTEVVPILSGGMSFNRFLKPYMIAAGLIFTVSFIFNIFIIPHTNKLMIDFENVYVKPLDNTNRRSTHMQIDERTYVYIGDFDTKYDEGYNFVLEKFDDNEMKEKWIADRIVWDSVALQWSIRNYTIRYIDGLQESMVSGQQLDTLLDMRPSDFVVYDNVYQAMGTMEIGDRIEKEKIRGTGIMVKLLLELYKRFVNPFSAFVLTLMGVALSSKKVRGGIGLSLGLGIGLSFTYIVFIQFTTIFASQGGFPPLLAVWIPNLVFGVIALFLLKKAPK
jgi:lipopolysaccharide export system permease protein